MKNYTKYPAIVTTILLSVAIAGPANATSTETPSQPTVEVQPESSVVAAVNTASLKYERPVVKTSPAPVAVEPVKVAEAVPPAPPSPTTPAVAPATPVVTPKTTQIAQAAPPAPPAAVPVSNKGAALLASAYSQIGITQDCTAMVEHALASIGIISGDLAPAQFFRFGPAVSSPQPGDILISAGHVGIYAGNGQMISGGFNGSQTVLHPVSYVGAYSAVRVA